MKTSTALLTGLLLCGVVTAAAAATDREMYQKRVGKVAPPSDAKPKALCACSFDTDPVFRNRVGFIRQVVQNNQVTVRCAGDVFDAAGSNVGDFVCLDFYPLTK
jgi:hypothetical protein